ncbi:MAG: LysR family transcriptional regulator [Gammaproteobacteria bacterium]|nr:LysR family transcriptional regulator [Gammaproteobacteria bacterium]
MRLDPVSLRLFVSVIEEGSIARAAERCFIAPSAISKRISEMEKALQTSLLTRTNRGVIATEAGNVLLQLSRGVLHQLDEIFSQMSDYARGVRGNIRVVANISSISQFLPTQLKSFLDLYPLVQIDLEEKISTEVLRAVAENAADIGIFTYSPAVDVAGLNIHSYKGDHLVLITPLHHRLSGLSEVAFANTLGYDYVGLHTGSAINLQMLRVSSRVEAPLKLRIQVTSYEALCSMVESGLGIGLMPNDIASAYIKAGRIAAVPLSDAWARRELRICVREDKPQLEATRRLLNHLRTT